MRPIRRRWRPVSGAGGTHVDLGAEPQVRRAAGVVEIEHDPLALADHPEDRAFEGVGREVVVGEIGVAHDDAEPEPGS